MRTLVLPNFTPCISFAVWRLDSECFSFLLVSEVGFDFIGSTVRCRHISNLEPKIRNRCKLCLIKHIKISIAHSIFHKLKFFLKNPLTFSAECSRINKSVEDSGSQKTSGKPNEISGEWEHSSAGRASALQAEGHRFEPYCSHQNDAELFAKAIPHNIRPGSSVG